MRVLLILITLMLVGCATTANNTQNKLNTYIGSNIDDFLIQHPVLKLNPEIRKHIERASESLTEAYSMLGEESLKK